MEPSNPAPADLSALSLPHTIQISDILQASSGSTTIEKKWIDSLDFRYHRLLTLLQYYENYYTSWMDIYKAMTKSLMEMSKLVILPGPGGMGTSGSPANSPGESLSQKFPLSAIVVQTQAIAIEESNRVKNFRTIIENKYLKEITKLKGQLKKLIKSSKEKLSQADTVRSRDLVTFRSYLAKFYDHKKIGELEDPWLMEQQLFLSLQNFVNTENSYRQCICNATVALVSYEQMLFETTKTLFLSYTKDYRTQCDESCALADKLDSIHINNLGVHGLRDIEATFEVNNLSMHADKLVSQGLKPSLMDASLLLEAILTTNSPKNGSKASSPVSDQNAATSNGKDKIGRLHRILKFGILSKPGVFLKKSYKPQFSVITENGFLHSYNLSSGITPERAFEMLALPAHLTTPSMTVPLTKSEVHPVEPATGLFEIIVNPGQSGIFGKEVHFTLKADNESELNDWIKEFKKFCPSSSTSENNYPSQPDQSVRSSTSSKQRLEAVNAGSTIVSSVKGIISERNSVKSDDIDTSASIQGVYPSDNVNNGSVVEGASVFTASDTAREAQSSYSDFKGAIIDEEHPEETTSAPNNNDDFDDFEGSAPAAPVPHIDNPWD